MILTSKARMWILLSLLTSFAAYLFPVQAITTAPPSFSPGRVYHNPNSGRFWTMDSFEGFGSDPASLHKYTYCGNNPINAWDPSGRITLSGQVIVTAISTTVRAMVVKAFLGSMVGAYVGFHVGFYDAITHGEREPDRILDRMIGGAVGGAIIGGAYGATSALPPPWSRILGAGLTGYLLSLAAQDVGTSFGEGHHVGGVFRSVLLVFGVKFSARELTLAYQESYGPGRLVVGGVRNRVGKYANAPTPQPGDTVLNTDPLAGAEVQADLQTRPFNGTKFTEVYFEYVPYDAFTGANIGGLIEAGRLVKPGGRLIIETGPGAVETLPEILKTLENLGFKTPTVQESPIVRITATKRTL